MRTKSIMALWLFLGTALLTPTAHAAVIAVGPGAFPASSSLITFTGLAFGTEVNGLTVGGVQFSYSLGNGARHNRRWARADENVDPPNIVSIGNNTGTLILNLPSLSTLFGYGYAILNEDPVTNATTITLFSGATNVGTLSYDGVPDPVFTGGFAGIQSTIPFDTVHLTFDSVFSPAFAVDNIRFATPPSPSRRRYYCC